MFFIGAMREGSFAYALGVVQHAGRYLLVIFVAGCWRGGFLCTSIPIMFIGMMSLAGWLLSLGGSAPDCSRRATPPDSTM